MKKTIREEIEYVVPDPGHGRSDIEGMNTDSSEALFSTFEFELDDFGVENQFMLLFGLCMIIIVFPGGIGATLIIMVVFGLQN